jgi:hypothetical protein
MNIINSLLDILAHKRISGMVQGVTHTHEGYEYNIGGMNVRAPKGFRADIGEKVSVVVNRIPCAYDEDAGGAHLFYNAVDMYRVKN